MDRFAEILPSDIQDWKAKYGEKSLSQLTVTVEEDTYQFVVRKPSRSVLEALGKTKDDVAQANKILVSNCVLGGDTYVFEEDGNVYLEVLSQLSKLSKTATVEVKKL